MKKREERREGREKRRKRIKRSEEEWRDRLCLHDKQAHCALLFRKGLTQADGHWPLVECIALCCAKLNFSLFSLSLSTSLSLFYSL